MRLTNIGSYILIGSIVLWLNPPSYSDELKRTILGLYDSTEEYNQTQDRNWVHRFAQMPLNYLGMKVRLHDIAEGLPDDKDMADVYGVLSWFADSDMSDSNAYLSWAIRMIKSGKKFVVLGNLGALNDRGTGKGSNPDLIDQFFDALGMENLGNWTDDPYVLEVTYKDSKMVEFERNLAGDVDYYENLKPSSPRAKVYLEINRKDIENGASALVLTTPSGGAAFGSYAIYFNYLNEMGRWRIDPFAFFNEAFALESRPRMDVTTLMGRRIFYSHIDGDGFRNLSQLDAKKYAGETIYEEILKKYSLPVTVSFITSEVDLRYFGSNRLLDIARKILTLPNVEVGIHTFSHPLQWRKKLTAFVIKGYSKKTSDWNSDEEKLDTLYPNAAVITVDEKKYLEEEITNAVHYLNKNIAPKDKQVKLFQWSGNCKPQELAIKKVDELGLMNLNGGDSRFDRAFPSYTFVAPLSRQLGNRIQVYSSNANENIYTDGWSSNYHGFLNVIETFEQTEIPTLINQVPRRVSAINIYYHFYSGENSLSINSLKKAYDYVLSREVIAVYASQYANCVQGFYSAKFEQLPDGGWLVKGYGEDRTLRFDNTTLWPDLAKSRGVMGYRRWANYLYVFLKDQDSATVYLAEKKNGTIPYLEDSANLIQNWKATRDNVSFFCQGFGQGTVQINNLEPRSAYQISVLDKNRVDSQSARQIHSDSQGELKLDFPLTGGKEVRLARAH